MTGHAGSSMRPISEAHLRLGRALRQAREASGCSTRQVPRLNLEHPYFSSGHISLVEHGRTAPSPELIDAYVGLAANGAELRALYEQMLAASQESNRRRRGDDLPDDRLPPQHLNEVSDRHDVQRHYIVETSQAHYVFDERGAVKEVNTTVSIRARTAGVRLYYTAYTYQADQRPGVLDVEAGVGCTLVGTRESASGALQSFFQLEEMLSPADPEAYSLSFRIFVKSIIPCLPRLRYYAAAGNQTMILRAQFVPPAYPSRIWWFGVSDPIDAEYPQPISEFETQGPGDYYHVFDRLIPGWCYGFGWSWL
jgi:transcriptional regulator with XRE-family HTH domain